ncbi:hypothetical protein [Donghicola sp.]|jgi:hypothetical protein|uniref:hypothetical protein n=1 Tax=Donghicola sp. TaxID=1929294 RepID=UPI0025E37F5C|nr:hypothetical protein [Donghicola sp.]MCT4577054.1 hypothetical protein [Donghicola sp.]
MEKCLFVAETDDSNAVSHVWFHSKNSLPRPVQPCDVTPDHLSNAEFSGAPAESISAWLERFASDL